MYNYFLTPSLFLYPLVPVNNFILLSYFVEVAEGGKKREREIKLKQNMETLHFSTLVLLVYQKHLLKCFSVHIMQYKVILSVPIGNCALTMEHNFLR